MSEDLHHECGVAALYWLGRPMSRGGRASGCAAGGIVAPCFYGIDMSTLGELFAPKFIKARAYRGQPTGEQLARMALALGVDSLRYLSVDDLAPCLGIENESMCTGCVLGRYPTEWGNKMIRRARRTPARGRESRTYE